jgi:hypothetical protein
MVRDKKNLPMVNTIVILFTTQNHGIFKMDTTDEKGHFTFILPGYSDTTQFMLQVNDRKGRVLDAKITLDSILLPQFKTPLYLKKLLPGNATMEILQKKTEPQDFLMPARGKELKEVIVRTRVKKPVSYDEQKRVSLFSRIITPEMLERAGLGNLSSLLFMIPGAHLISGKLVIDPGGDAEPLVIMDGVEVPLGNNSITTFTSSGKDTAVPSMSIEGPSPLVAFLNSLSPRYIDFIEVLNGPEAGIYGVRAGNGVVAIHTRATQRDDYSGKQNPLKRFSPLGFSSSALFAEPDYNKKEVRKNNSPDQRSTIYWSGPVITDENGKASVNFFTADPNTTYTVTVKGITASGDIFFKRFLINRN